MPTVMRVLQDSAAQGKPPEAEDAFEAYSALRRMACNEPWLATNEHFEALQDTAYARFLAAFKAIK